MALNLTRVITGDVASVLGSSADSLIEGYTDLLTEIGNSIDASVGKLTIQTYGNEQVRIRGNLKRENTTARWGYDVQIERLFKLVDGQWVLSNDLMVIGEDLQKFGIADKINFVGAKVLKQLGGKLVEVHANIDVGGYAWLRKGFWPNGRSGAQVVRRFIELAVKEKRLTLDKALVKKVLSLGDAQLKDYVLTDEFRQFKDAFLRTDWFGSADITDPKVYAAFTGQKLNPPKLTANEELADAMVRHQTYLLRFSANIQSRINNILNRTEMDIAQRIRDRLSGNVGLNTPVEWQRLQSLVASIDRIRSGGWEDAISYLNTQAIGLATAEPAFMQTILTDIAPVVINTALPSPRMLKAIVTDRPFQGKILKDWAAGMQSEDLRRIHNAIQMGMVAGEDSATIARRVVGTAALKGTDGVTQLTRRQVVAVTRTAVMHIADSARHAYIEENKDLFDQEMFVATLDSRTTPICRSLDGKKFRIGTGPRPPLHFQCRSLRVVAMNGELIGQRPAKASTEASLLREFAKQNGLGSLANRDAIPRGMKGAYDAFSRKRIRELTGQVPSSTTYQQWLSRQSAQFQNDILGVKKAQLFRDGGLKLDQFVAPNGSELTLNQLAAKYPGAFKAAGLDAAVF